MWCCNQTNPCMKNLPKPFSHRNKISESTDLSWLSCAARSYSLLQAPANSHGQWLNLGPGMLFWSKSEGTFWCCLEQESVTGSKLEKLQKGCYAYKRRLWLSVSFQSTTLILPCESLRWMPRNGRIGKHLVCSWKWLLSNSGRKQLYEIFLILQQGTKEPIAWLQLVHNHDPVASNEFDFTIVMRISVTLRKP